MDLNKISNYIKKKRRELGITQEELAEKLFVTEKAISRWETGRGTPDISLLIPLSNELGVEVSEILNGEDNKKSKKEIEQLIQYNELMRKSKFNFKLSFVILLYFISILAFLVYLRFEYDPSIEINYFIRLGIIFISSILIIIGNKVYENNYVEKLEDKEKVRKFSQMIVFIYYVILLFNMVIFARYTNISGYNLIPFKSIVGIISSGSLYTIVINILGNLIVYMPLEYFLVELFKIDKLIINFLLSFIIILSIETFQFVFKVGVLDIDDLLLCTLGMMIFYIFYKKIKTMKN